MLLLKLTQCLLVPQLGVQGILVLDARKGGPAWKSGIKGTSRDKYGRLVLGDIITAVNNKRVRTASDLYKLLDKCSIGDTIDMEVEPANVFAYTFANMLHKSCAVRTNGNHVVPQVCGQKHADCKQCLVAKCG